MLLGFVAPAMAQRRQTRTESANFGLPTHRRDGGSRGSQDSCVASAKNQNLMALIPQRTVGVSASTSPKLFFYVPELESQSTLEFVLRNEEDKLVYEAFLSTEGDGIMSVEIPSDLEANTLEADQNYHWYLSMICDGQQRSRDIVVEGWMRQEAMDVATQEKLTTASLIEKVEVYREQGFWYDALSALTENPDSVTEKTMARQKWSEMLASVGLADLASEPLLETKIVENPANSL
ncbi:MAG: DUF928 domain-containing protein [Cyanobacteria bacterium J06621_12]